jgi:serine/threonine-protein kinase RsbW
LHEEVENLPRRGTTSGRFGGADVTEDSTTSSASQAIQATRTIAADYDSHSEQPEHGHQLATAVEPPADAPADGEVRDEVTIRLPADGAYLSVLRTATAGLAARLDFTLDEIEDMRIAVDEACAMLLSQAIPGTGLECGFRLGQDSMTISVSVRCLAPRVPAGDTFAWTVLSALAGSVDAQVGPGDLLTIVLRKSRDSSRSA